MTATKNATIQIIRKSGMNEKVKNVDKLRAFVLNHFMDEITPSHKALLYIKKEVGEMY